MPENNTVITIPFWKKACLSIDEASLLSGIGTTKLRTITENPECDFVIWIGRRRIIKRKKFEEYLENAEYI